MTDFLLGMIAGAGLFVIPATACSLYAWRHPDKVIKSIWRQSAKANKKAA